ncbi:MAG: zinc-dependent metalloprotease [Actinobacteria bacterium]|nr:zinc-dependent metalloprotease [Actinomycetota bacterium]
MDPTDRPGRPDVPLGDVFAEVPLFREIQRVLLSSAGPVNWELARQIGIAMASWGTEDPPPTDEDRRGLEETVRAAELHVAELTGLPVPADVAPVEAVRRGGWVEANIRGLKDLIEPAAAKAADALSRAQRQAGSGELPGPGGMGGIGGMPGGLEALFSQLSPLLLGAQVGTVLGYLGQRVLGQYDVAVPRSGPGNLLFVVPNIAAFERDWSLSPVEFRAWVALHEVTHRFEFARPWAGDHFRGLVTDFVSSVELDVGDLMERLKRMDVGSPEALQSLLESEEGLFGAVLDDEQRLKLARVQAFMAAAEGYGDHVMRVLGRRMLGTFDQIEEAMRRHREGETGDPVFERLLGIDMKKEQYRLGQAFCDRVAELTDEATLASMWDGPEALPSTPELEEPQLWLARMA